VCQAASQLVEMRVVCKSKRSRKKEGEARSLWDSVHWSRSGAECMCWCAGRRSVSKGPVWAGGMQGRRGNVGTSQQAMGV
jgi:hypothetical protein